MLRILLAEDDPMISEIYQKKFLGSGFEVFMAASGDEALNVAKKEKVDVILLDLIMPKINGFQVIERLRKEGHDPGVKIVISSNLSQREDRERALRLGADGFIAKSEYNPSELVEEVKRILSQQKEQEKNNDSRENQARLKKEAEKRKPRILLMEDEDVFIEMFGDRLKQDGYDVQCIKNGVQATREALKGGFDLFIIDMVLPGMTAEEIVARLKLEDKIKQIPIFILSASFEDDISKRVKDMGVDSFFIKTQITPSELSKEVKKILA